MDEELTLRTLKRNNIGNEVVVARDGAEGLDYLFTRGPTETGTTPHRPRSSSWTSRL